MKTGNFISLWDEGSITTPATLDEDTGEVTTNSVDAEGMENLIEEWFEDEEGEIYEICTECHTHILKTVMKEGVGKTLYEVEVCSNPDCINI